MGKELVRHYQAVANAFDEAAGSYDRQYGENQIMAWMRAESLHALRESFGVGSRLLEIGCGTGEEALALAASGYRIVATDISEAMIEVARAKAREQGVGSVSWKALPAGQIAELADEVGDTALDGAYASFGALNCEPRLDMVVEGLARLLRPGARVVCSVMNRWCAWEILWGVAHLRPREAFRRHRVGWADAGLEAPSGRLAVPTHYYTPRELKRAFAPRFALSLVRGLPVLFPPPYLAPLVERFPGLFRRLAPAEHLVRDRFPFSAAGDHFLAVLVRAEEEAGV